MCTFLESAGRSRASAEGADMVAALVVGDWVGKRKASGALRYKYGICLHKKKKSSYRGELLIDRYAGVHWHH